jgi:DNA processing protein
VNGSQPARWHIERGEAAYPFELEDLPDPPGVLYGFGDPALLGGGLAVIGSRKATPYGLACARRFAGWTAAHGIPVVSGAAIGCDLESHRAALD